MPGQTRDELITTIIFSEFITFDQQLLPQHSKLKELIGINSSISHNTYEMFFWLVVEKFINTMVSRFFGISPTDSKYFRFLQ